MRLEGMVVVVSGGLGNLGAAVASAARARGARVAVVDRVAAPEEFEVDDNLLVLGDVDLASYEAAQSALARVVQHFGTIDALVNVAGTFRWETLEGGDVATWDLLYNVNVRTAVAASKAVVPHLKAKGAGRIVNIGAASAAKGAAGMGPYAASKSAVARLTESLADELKDNGITVNAVLPSIIDTPQNRADMPNADHARWVAPEALAEVILFLLSPAAAAVTGATIPVVGRV
ncbi:MAG TPA: SDR family NAD(P)-dependent oxidoreductase [Xanthomonadales bacterium]|nr:SDR family NAD(P)-dependent oxidoreductase [Xanthomonadales bacterium]